MSTFTRFGQIPNPKKEFSVPINIDRVMEFAKMIPEVSQFRRDNTDGSLLKKFAGTYTLKNYDEFLKQVVYHSKETLSMGSNITISLEEVDDNKTKVHIEIAREMGSFDEPSEIQQANNDMNNITTYLSALCNPNKNWEDIILESCKQTNDKVNEGCYIATSVYGSYDCNEVQVLRHFRDSVLRNSLLGNYFISSYYATAPTLVKLTKNMSTFNFVVKKLLDKLVNKLS